MFWRGAPFEWRRWSIYIHRWLGIAGSLVFLVWFGSGIVMMYERMPRLTPEERLARLPALASAGIEVSLATAARTAGVTPDRVRVGMILDRPVYRFGAGGEWTTVFADSGERLDGVSAQEAAAIVGRLVPEAAATLHSTGRLTEPDQWTLDGGLPRFLPMQRVALGDPEGTMVYVSERTGEPVMKTTARGRAFGYAGAVLHWTYFTPVRVHRGLWRYSIIFAALAGCVMCLSGLFVGIWRLSVRRRYRLKGVRSHSPYAGWMWWHHHAGLLFGLFTFTWALSGALSLTPWDWVGSTDPTSDQQRLVSGGALRADVVSADSLRAVARSISRSFPVKELEVLQFSGRPFALSYRAEALDLAKQSRNRDVSAIYSPQLAQAHVNAWLDDLDAPTFESFDRASVLRVARTLVPQAAVREARWLAEYDSYYYDRTGAKPLPVLRASYDDTHRTALYVDPRSGLIAMQQTRRTRVNRWLYNGLHSLDFPFLYYRRPGWDIVVLACSAGGLVLTASTMVPALRRLRRHVIRRIHSPRFRRIVPAAALVRIRRT